jgi:hypothetical protein
MTETQAFGVTLCCDQMHLKDRFPEIYDICIEQNVTVAEAADMHWNFSFRRWMTHDLAC